MKKVILQKEEVTIELSKVSPDKYYGVLNRSGSKGLITKRKYATGQYSAFCSESITKGNSWDMNDSDTITGLVKNLIELSNFSVYEFDTSKELFTWLVE
jgi:hypothetical protein